MEMFEQETIKLYQEECDCGGQTRHNNGGNYHRETNVHTFVADDNEECYCVILEETTSREAFPREEYEHLLYQGGRWELVHGDQLSDDEYENSEIAFRRGEAKIIASA
jgi:hypothetical protein